MNKTILIGLPALAAVWAQPSPPPPPLPPEPRHAMVQFVAAEGVRFSNKPVKGIPYAAEGVHESLLVLADGNRISRRTTSSAYRDSQGRTRNEHTLPSVGPWSSSGEKMVTIFDPVAKVSITLHPDKTATKWAVSAGEGPAAGALSERQMEGPFLLVLEGGPGTGGAGGVRAMETIKHDILIERSRDSALAAGAPVAVEGVVGAGTARRSDADHKSIRSESLGKKVIEGVEAEGTRAVMTIEAGEIGNERRIEVVDETWYSKELEALVYSKHSDPRTGETTYRLTNIRRGEQPPDLFEVPADYKIREGAGKLDVRIKRQE